MDLHETVETFLKHLQTQGYSERTVTDYRYNLRYFLDYLTDRKVSSFSKVSPETILAYQDYIHHEYKPVRKKVLSLGYQVNLLKVLKKLFVYLVRDGKILSDPTTGLKLPKLPKRLPSVVLTKREIKKLLSSPDTTKPSGMRDRAVLEILYSTGIRKRELGNLKLYDVDLTNRQVTVREGKGKKDRILPLTKKAAEVVDVYVREHREALVNGKDPGHAILNDRGRKLGRKWTAWMLAKYVTAVKIKKNVTTHTFRHTFATHLLKNGVSIRVIQELLGHASLTSTQIYTKVEITDLRRVIDKKHPREDME